MTDVDVYEQSPTAIEAWAGDLLTAYGAAVKLVTTSFVPDSYRDKPEEAAAAILMGQEIGLSPMAALRSIDIIKGVPGMRAVALRALVQSHGHEIWTEEQTATRCIVKGKRKGSDHVETSTWTIERATQLGLAGNDNYRKQPMAMLLARATSECARLVDADGLLGIPYSTEELEDLGDRAGAADAATVKRPVRKTVQRAALDPARGEVPLPDEVGESAAVSVLAEQPSVVEPPVERDESAIADAAAAAFADEPWEPAVPEGDALI